MFSQFQGQLFIRKASLQLDSLGAISFPFTFGLKWQLVSIPRSSRKYLLVTFIVDISKLVTFVDLLEILDQTFTLTSMTFLFLEEKDIVKWSKRQGKLVENSL